MKNITKYRLAITILTILFFNFNATFAQKNQANNYQKLDSFLTELSAHNKMMGSFTITKNNELKYSKTTGFSVLKNEEKTPATNDTKYRIGSITKTFTAVMIFQMIEEKKLDLETKLSKFFPKIPNADKITINHLLSHRSGLFNLTSDSAYLQWNTKPKTQKEMLAMIQKQKPVFQPDAKAEYSNTNYILLGYIIEKISGKSYAEELQNRIVSKIGLKNTWYGKKTEPSKNEAYSYVIKANDNWEQESETDMGIPHGAGAIVSTTNELAQFFTALFTGKLISQESLKEMTTIKDGYGKGIFQYPFGNRKAYGHNGGIDGFRSSAAFFPDDSVAVAFCSNGVNYNTNDLMLAALSAHYNKPYEYPALKTVSIAAEELSKFEGIYSSTQLPLKITIRKEGNSLTAQATGQSAFPLEATSETSFKFDPAGVVIDFKKSAEGLVDTLILKQAGGQYLFKKGQ